MSSGSLSLCDVNALSLCDVSNDCALDTASRDRGTYPLGVSNDGSESRDLIGVDMADFGVSSEIHRGVF